MAAKLSSLRRSIPMFFGFSLLLQIMSFSIELRDRTVDGLTSFTDRFAEKRSIKLYLFTQGIDICPKRFLLEKEGTKRFLF